MSSLQGTNLPKPKNWQDFERKVRELFACVLADPNTQLHGRTGQKQHGVDVYGRRATTGRLVGVQCKKALDRLITSEELRKELEKARKFTPPIAELILVTTAPRDAKSQEYARKLTESERKKKRGIQVSVWGWDDIEEQAARHKDAWLAFDPMFHPFAMSESKPHPQDIALLKKLRSLVTPTLHNFLWQQNFGYPFLRAAVDPLGIIADDWIGASYEFEDKEVQPAFGKFLVLNRQFVGMVSERAFVVDNNPKYLTTKTRVDQAEGTSAITQASNKAINDKARQLWIAIDELERVARRRIPIDSA